MWQAHLARLHKGLPAPLRGVKTGLLSPSLSRGWLPPGGLGLGVAKKETP